MSDGFFRYPHTPHLTWLGKGKPRDDKLLSQEEAGVLLSGDVVIEEKLDGANIGLSIGPEGAVRAQNRGQYLLEPYSGQFISLGLWIAIHENALFDALGENLILFGEWCAARHSVKYDNLPDWFLAFDLYDRSVGRFWSSRRRDALARQLNISIVATLLRRTVSLTELTSLVQSASSQYREGPVEGIVLRKESEEWLIDRAKLVRADFVQNIGEHWRRRRIEWNRVHGQLTRGDSTAQKR